MAVTFDIELQGASPTTIVPIDPLDPLVGDFLRFAGAGFTDPIFVNGWNDSTHVREANGTDKSNGNTPNNVKFISQTGGTGGDSQADWGDGTEDLDQITNAEATLKIDVTEGVNITITDAVFYSYDDGGVPVDPPVGMSVKAAEVGDTNFTDAEGSANALLLNDKLTPATTHSFYIALSKSPTAIGLNQCFDRFEVVIQ